jgi:hypothetical protein
MTFKETDASRPPRVARRRMALLAPMALVVATFVLAAACTSGHKNAVATSSPASSLSGGALSSGPVAPLSSGPASGSSGSAPPPASPSVAASLPTPVSSEVAPGPPVANIEAPAPKSGFKIRVHRGGLLKVNVPQAKAGATLAFALDPASSKSLKPLAGYEGYFIGTADGVVAVQASEDGVAVGTLTVTVWG